MAKLIQTTVASTGQVDQYKHAALLQDLMALTAIISPIIIIIGFFFTLKSKTVELEKSLASLTKHIEENMQSAHEILLLKFDAKLTIFSERMDVLKCETRENSESIKLLKEEVSQEKQARQDILSQLSKMGIDLYIVGENDRRGKNKLD